MKLPALYPIVDVADPSAATLARAVRLATTLAEGGLSLLQLRAKTLGAGAFTELAARLGPALAERGCRLLVNDRADVALAAATTGLHVGDEDLPVGAARRLLGPDCIIGYSTHAVDEVRAACSLPADYLGFGPVFDSPTKAGVREARGLALLEQACAAATLPIVAIGGVTVETAPLCWRAGAASVAVISELAGQPDQGSVLRLLDRYRRAAAEQGLSL